MNQRTNRPKHQQEETEGMNQYSKLWYKIPNKQSNNNQKQRINNKELLTGIEFPGAMRNTLTVLTLPPVSSARRRRPPSADQPPPPKPTTAALRITLTGYIMPPQFSARPNPSQKTDTAQTSQDQFQNTRSDQRHSHFTQFRVQR